MFDIIMDAVIDTARLAPFLFVTYLIMEWVEHRTKHQMSRIVKGHGVGGPIVGGLLGLLPQCGFSASAAGLYAGRMISMGTLIAIFISTSDEMLPILLSERVGAGPILRILMLKMAVAVIAGIGIDLWRRSFSKETGENRIHSMCEHDHCHCENGIFRSALHHTLQIGSFILLICLVLNLLIFYIGEDTISGFLLARPVLGPLVAGIVGLIPNCAASVMLTQLYLEGLLSFGAVMSGLIAGSGIGLLVLFRTNPDKRENLVIVGILYGIGAGVGILIDFLQ